jgi:probable HAF family extracellular repeat protein
MRRKRLSRVLFHLAPAAAAGLLASACGGDSSGPSPLGGASGPHLSASTVITPAPASPIGAPTGYPEHVAAVDGVTGLAVGWLGDPNQGQSQAMVWQNGVPSPLPGLGGAISAANDVNANGAIVGIADNGDFTPRPVKWVGGAIQELPIAQGFIGGVAKAINNNGGVVGWMIRADGTPRAYRWTPAGQPVAIPIPEEFVANQANDINDHGVVVGWTRFALSPNEPVNDRVFVFDIPNNSNNFIAPLGGTASRALAVNNGGLVTGWTTLNGRRTAVRFHWTNGGGIDLGAALPNAESFGMGINEDGSVVGRVESLDPNTGAPRTDAFLWQAAANPTLTQLLPLVPGAQASATDIADQGYIVGWAGNGQGGKLGAVWAPPRATPTATASPTPPTTARPSRTPARRTRTATAPATPASAARR